MSLFGFLGNYSEREIKRITPIIDKIEKLDIATSELSDEELRAKTDEFKTRINNGETLDSILPEAFAVVREAGKRVLSMKHYKVQLIGGVVLHQGRIAEMKTGEGKTLVATLPAYLNALEGKGVHIVTTNDYLAKRDRDEMGRIHEFLGLSVGVILHDMSPEERREAYKADITYATNNELGFDYLKDNMVLDVKERVQRGLNYAIVDEIDSILIDEARTPLIISGEGEKSTEIYFISDRLVKSFIQEDDYIIDEKLKAITLTEKGVSKVEKAFNINNYADLDNLEIQHHITQALKANYIMKKNKEYIIKDGEIYIVDEFTGRVMEGRRFSDGLHQSIEAKERVKVREENKTLATITLQNYFRTYTKLSGMTGTAVTEEHEFRDIYSLDVVVIPTNKPIKRVDYNDVVYKTTMGKYNAIVDEIIESNKKGQPVLVGTSNIEKSEDISFLLKRKGIKHRVLNAKNHELEAKIVERAGEEGAVTIATNMAGRGTDIKLQEEVEELGGLKVIGTERHESRRIDNQLRGRSGRQGDSGESKFFLSLEDDILKNFISDRYKSVLEKMEIDEDKAIEGNVLTKAIEGAQKNVEGNNFASRKDLIGFDDVINKQREVIYSQRNIVLDNEDIKDYIISIIKDCVNFIVDLNISDDKKKRITEIDEAIKSINSWFEDEDRIGELDLQQKEKSSKEDIGKLLTDKITTLYEEKENKVGKEEFRTLEKLVLLRVVDEKWVNHLDDLDHLKQGIKLRAYRQIDPVQAFQLESSKMFEDMILSIKLEVVSILFHTSIKTKEMA